MKNYNYGKRIKTSLNKFISFHEKGKIWNININDRKELENDICNYIKNNGLLKKSPQQIERIFKGNEKHYRMLQTIWAINKFYMSEIGLIKLDLIIKVFDHFLEGSIKIEEALKYKDLLGANQINDVRRNLYQIEKKRLP